MLQRVLKSRLLQLLSDDVVAFNGFGSGGQQGIYAYIAGSLIKIVDGNDRFNVQAPGQFHLDTNSVADNKIFSNVLEFDPKTLGVAWNYAGSLDEPFRTSIIGRLQRLPNGNTLIAESMKARVFEVTPKGEIVWNYALQKVKRPDRTLNAITTSVRYSEQELPFLKEKTDATH